MLPERRARPEREAERLVTRTLALDRRPSRPERESRLGLPEARPHVRDGCLRRRAVHGFKSTPAGNPLDSFAATPASPRSTRRPGPGWKRENSFLMCKDSATCCYGFYPTPVPAGRHGELYRATIIGPDVMWQGDALSTYDPPLDRQHADIERELFASRTAFASQSEPLLDAGWSPTPLRAPLRADLKLMAVPRRATVRRTDQEETAPRQPPFGHRLDADIGS